MALAYIHVVVIDIVMAASLETFACLLHLNLPSVELQQRRWKTLRSTRERKKVDGVMVFFGELNTATRSLLRDQRMSTNSQTKTNSVRVDA